MKVVILGAGVLGVTTAYFLCKRGHQVTVVDREPESALECSFANGGQLSYSHGEPWASPDSLKKAMQWMVQKEAPLKVRMRADPAMMKWGMQFVGRCKNRYVEEATQTMLRLGLYSRDVMHEIADAHPDLRFRYRKHGILHVFEKPEVLAGYKKQCEFQEPLGIPFEVLNVDQVLEKEPSLHYRREHIVGGIFSPLDESADVRIFTQALTEIDKQMAPDVEFLYDTDIQKLESDGQKITRVITDKGDLEADMFVMCMGAYSPLYLKQVGIKVPIYPMKGYSISIPLAEDLYDKDAPHVSITDHKYKVVFSRLGDVLRLAGTAEFAGYNHDVTDSRIRMLKKRAKAFFPDAGDIESAEPWACLRPSTPDGPPILGETKLPNLMLNTGHGTLGWTQGAGSAKIVADLIEGNEPEIALDGLTLARYK